MGFHITHEVTINGAFFSSGFPSRPIPLTINKKIRIGKDSQIFIKEKNKEYLQK